MVCEGEADPLMSSPSREAVTWLEVSAEARLHRGLYYEKNLFITWEISITGEMRLEPVSSGIVTRRNVRKEVCWTVSREMRK